jgi:hypothetical protein
MLRLRTRQLEKWRKKKQVTRFLSDLMKVSPFNYGTFRFLSDLMKVSSFNYGTFQLNNGEKI